MTARNNLYELQIKLTLEMARTNLRNSFQIKGQSDAQLIRASLTQLPDLPRITHFKDLVLLRWVTILMDHLSPHHPEYKELYQLWYEAKSRAGDVM